MTKKKKALIVSTVSRQFWLFEKTNIEVLRQKGYEVHGAANFEDRNERLSEVDIIEHHIDIQRSPFSLKNWRAYRQLKTLIDKEGYELVHSHSPVGGVLGRLAAKAMKVSRVLYTAHGFHFFKGASVRHWGLFYPIEKLLSCITDDLIVINQEDYDVLSKRQFKMKRKHLVNGIGLDTSKFTQSTLENKQQLRYEYHLSQDLIVLICVGELSRRKNQMLLLKTMRVLQRSEPNKYHLLLVGKGDLESEYRTYIAEHHLDMCVSLLGYRNDIPALMQVSDLVVSASTQEGLPVNVMEAMACGLPAIVTNCRGNRDLVCDGKNGYVVELGNEKMVADKIKMLAHNVGLRMSMGEQSAEAVKKYSKENVYKQMNKIYE